MNMVINKLYIRWWSMIRAQDFLEESSDYYKRQMIQKQPQRVWLWCRYASVAVWISSNRSVSQRQSFVYSCNRRWWWCCPQSWIFLHTTLSIWKRFKFKKVVLNNYFQMFFFINLHFFCKVKGETSNASLIHILQTNVVLVVEIRIGCVA